MRVDRRGAFRSDRGVSLIELMVVLAIVGVLTAAAVVYVKPAQYGRSVRGHADALAAFIEGARDRAIATHAWQRVTIGVNGAEASQAPVTGFIKPALPTDYLYVGRLPNPSATIRVMMADPAPHMDPDTALPANGANLPLDLDFAPDGATQAATFFVSDQGRTAKARVVVFRATGAVLVLDSW